MLSKAYVAVSSRAIMLSILSQGENYGYQILQQVHELSAGRFQWTDGTLYPVLHRLEAEGLITSNWRTSSSGRKRKYYRLTETGWQALEAEKQQWLDIHAVLAELWGLEPRSSLHPGQA